MNSRALKFVVAVAAVLIAAAVFVLTGAGALFEGQALIRSFMTDSAGMIENAPVRLGGITIGRIKQIMFSGSANPQRSIEVDMLISQKYLAKIPEDSKAGITAANLLGDKYIDISLGSSTRYLKNGGEIGSQLTQDVPEILAQGSNWLTQVQRLLGRVDGLLNETEQEQGTLGKVLKDTSLANKLNATALEVHQLLTAAKAGDGAIGHLSELSEEMGKPMRRLDDLMADVQRNNARIKRDTASKVPDYQQLYDEAQATMSDARSGMAEAMKLLDDLNAGRGTAGKLLKDTELKEQLSEVARKFDIAVGKMNAGQGTIGQLMTNPDLRDSLEATSNEYHSAMKAYSEHPSKFRTFRVSLF